METEDELFNFFLILIRNGVHHKKDHIKISQLPSLTFRRWIATMKKAFKNREKIETLYEFGDANSEFGTFVWNLGDL